MRFCNRCGCKVDRETELDYPWVCPNCDENMFNVETYAVEELDLEWILYGLYLHDWIANHDVDDHARFDEFLVKEYLDEEQMIGLLVNYYLEHMVDEYRTRIQESD